MLESLFNKVADLLYWWNRDFNTGEICEICEISKNIYFEEQLQKDASEEDIKTIDKSNKTITLADKTRNIYLLSKEQYDHIINNLIPTKYKKTNNNIENQVNLHGKKILRNKEVFNQMQSNRKSSCLISLKDHFLNDPTAGLPNPAKNELGE